MQMILAYGSIFIHGDPIAQGREAKKEMLECLVISYYSLLYDDIMVLWRYIAICFRKLYVLHLLGFCGWQVAFFQLMSLDSVIKNYERQKQD